MKKSVFNKTYPINALVLHRVVSSLNQIKGFEDVIESMLVEILELKKNSYASLDSALNCNEKERVVCLTFDDGNLSDWEIVCPLLNKYMAKATFFIVTSKIDTPGYLNQSQIKKMHNQGMQIGSHSHTHPNFLKLNNNEIAEELTTSKRILENILDDTVTTFAFPYGKKSDKVVDQVLKIYDNCCTSRHGLFNTENNIIPRNSINSSMGWATIKKTILGHKTIRAKWILEDAGKKILKKSFGAMYPKIRAILIKFKVNK